MTDFSRKATEDNEINLVEGEYIEQIEEVGEGWWTGIGSGGKSGLFPCTSPYSLGVAAPDHVYDTANYVELVSFPEEQGGTVPSSPPPPLAPPVGIIRKE